MTVIEYLSLNKRYLVLHARLDSINLSLKIKRNSILTLIDRIDECNNYQCDDSLRIEGYVNEISQLKKDISTYQKSKIFVCIKLCFISLFTPLFWKHNFTK